MNCQESGSPRNCVRVVNNDRIRGSSCSWDSNTLHRLPTWPDLNPSASTCVWSVAAELNAFCREKAFQGTSDLFRIWLTLLWTCPMRSQTILALLFHPEYTTCLLDLVPSQRASSRCAFATVSPWEWETGPWRGLGLPVTYGSQRAAVWWLHRKALTVCRDRKGRLLALSGSQRADTITHFTASHWFVISVCVR